MPKELVDKLKTYGEKSYKGRYDVVKTEGKDLAKEMTKHGQIKTLVFFGHGVKKGPIYEYGKSWFPAPSQFKASDFAPNALALFETCNSMPYAKKFTAETRVESIGVQGTTFYGEVEIIAGRKTPLSQPHTAVGHRFTYTPFSKDHVDSETFSLSQNKGTPFLRIQNTDIPKAVAPLVR